METEGKLINSWIFEYLVHKCITRYFELESVSDDSDEQKLLGQDIKFICNYYGESHHLKGFDETTTKDFVCFLFLRLITMEKSLVKQENQIWCGFLEEEEEFTEILSKNIAFSSRDTVNEDICALARLSLIQTYVVYYKYFKRKDDARRWKQALKMFEDFVNVMGTEEYKDAYDSCIKTKNVHPSDDFLTEYIDTLKQLVNGLYSEYDEPRLITFAENYDHGPNNKRQERDDEKRSRNRSSSEGDTDQNLSEQKTDESYEGNHTVELKTLLKDRRPSSRSDVDEIKMEESSSLTRMRKHFRTFRKEDHLNKISRLEKKIDKRPPSHRLFRLGSWMPEEEKAFIKTTLDIGVGKWAEIKKVLKTSRSSQQLKDKWRLFKPIHIREVMREMKDV